MWKKVFLSLAALGVILVALYSLGSLLRPSIQGRIFETLVRHTETKQQNAHFAERPAGQLASVPPPAGLMSRYRISSRPFDGHTLWSMAPLEGENRQQVLYLHGGAYVSGISAMHWRTLAEFVDRCQCTFILPDYPLAPRHQVDETLHLLVSLYRELLATYVASNLTLMGDSAGGGLAMALAMQLRQKDLEQPARLILLSPWLDISLSNPDIARVDRHDPILSVPGLKQAGQAWAGPHALTDYQVSPLYGPLEELAPILLFTGTHDILMPDARRLRERAAAAHARLDYREYPGMLHCWYIADYLPETRELLEQVGQNLNP